MILNEAIIDYEKAHSVRIDYARPQEYVWVYDGGLFGKPLHKDTIIADYYVRREELEL